MKKAIITVVLIALAAIQDFHGQSLSGEVIYKIQLVRTEADLKNSNDRALIDAIMDIGNKQTTTLLFNNNQSSTVLNQHLISEDVNSGLREWARSMAFVKTVGSDYFFDKVSNTAIERKYSGQLVKKINKKLAWEITTESKMIGDYLCYKAETSEKSVNRIGQDRSVPITAWFAPSLPYGYGPSCYNGLPGLILELEYRETTFLASSITISNVSDSTIDFPKGKTILKEEYDKKMKSQY